MTPEARADRWFRRFERPYPVEMWRGTLTYSVVQLEAAVRDLRRSLRPHRRVLILWATGMVLIQIWPWWPFR